ncbi:MAG: glutamate formimidoyltransferase [Chloroflexota bacterium]|nr:MAG: glutamate formimidoyltransferase [Chloroflexota bacterium]
MSITQQERFMNTPLVECVPNFSDGRRPQVLEAIVSAIQRAAPVSVLDYSSDHDHNRSVVTFVGAPDDVLEAAFAAIQIAAQLIDMEVHRGQHPRIGATDVVPFVPLRGITLEQCAELARRLGERVGTELGIPVYLYEAAARRPERQNLEAVRRGEYEGLKSAIQSDPERAPDFGPSQLGKAGAVAIGARPPLIAFNVYLNTSEVEIAKQIAKAVRHSSGGLRYVKALGLLVDGKAQVSLNLTDYKHTPIQRALELIRREADRYGVRPVRTELIGLIPEDALIEAAIWYLQLSDFDPNQRILERRLQNLPPHLAAAEPPGDSAPPEPAVPKEATVRAAPTPDLAAFAQSVAQGTPMPGGGAVAALVGALAAALGEMVARLTIASSRERYAPVKAEMEALASRAAALRHALLEAIERDSRAFNAVVSAYQLPPTQPEREQSIQAALRDAAQVPLDVIMHCLEVIKLVRTATDRGLDRAAADAATGAYMAQAAIESSALNVRVNAALLNDSVLAHALTQQALSAVGEARALCADVIVIAETRAKLR